MEQEFDSNDLKLSMNSNEPSQIILEQSPKLNLQFPPTNTNHHPEMKKKDINKYVNMVKTSMADTLKKSLKHQFNGMYNEILKKLESEKEWERINDLNNKALIKHHIEKKKDHKDLGILDYDFLKAPDPHAKKKLRTAKSTMSPKNKRKGSNTSNLSNLSINKSPNKLLRATSNMSIISQHSKPSISQANMNEPFNLVDNSVRVNDKTIKSSTNFSSNNPYYKKKVIPKEKRFPQSNFLTKSNHAITNATHISQVNNNIHSKYHDNDEIYENEHMNSSNEDELKYKDEDTYEKNKRFKFISEKMLQHQRREKDQEEQALLKEKPTISKNTKKIIKEKFSHEKPIYQRVYDVIETKRRNLAMKRIEKQEEEERINNIQNHVNKPLRKENNHNRSMSNMNKSISSDYGYLQPHQLNQSNLQNQSNQSNNGNRFKEWIKDQKNHGQKKIEEINAMKEYYQELDIQRYEMTFKPKISKNSEKLAKVRSLNKSMDGMEVADRLQNEYFEKITRKRELVNKLKPSFMPKVNNKVPSYIKVKSLIDNVFVDKTLNRDFFDDDDDEEDKNNSREVLNITKDNKDNKNNKQSKMKQKEVIKPKEQVFMSAKQLQLEKERKIIEDIKNKELMLNQQIKNVNIKKELDNNANDTTKINENLYRINIRDSSAWDKNKENTLLYDPTIDFLFKI